jgi:hypothetical protein
MRPDRSLHQAEGRGEEVADDLHSPRHGRTEGRFDRGVDGEGPL